jgi:hypothetical protein
MIHMTTHFLPPPHTHTKTQVGNGATPTPAPLTPYLPPIVDGAGVGLARAWLNWPIMCDSKCQIWRRNNDDFYMKDHATNKEQTKGLRHKDLCNRE